MTSRPILFAGVLLLVASTAMATSFVVPEDAELIAKTTAIAIGTVEGSYVQETTGVIETVYEVRVEQVLKGLPQKTELLRVTSPGGVIGDRGLFVAGAPHFAQGDRVLLFLIREKGSWRTTDLTLGAFRFVVSTSGQRLLVRDLEDVVGWDHHGQVHREKVRREEGFLTFIDERVRGGAQKVRSEDYLVEASEVTLPAPPDKQRFDISADAPFPGSTYTDWVQNQPIRRTNAASGITYRKRADQNISGQADGGVSVIQGGLAAWTNEPGSNINMIYGGTTTTPATDFDNVNVVEFNDPQNRVSGSWGGSGTIAIAFMSFSGSHQFEGRTWWNISDGDVVFQNGYPGTHGSFRTAMTHELGHTLGWRHSNQDYVTGGACNSSTQECTSAAIMNSTVNGSYGYTLQTWDVNAAQSVYPGSGTPPPPPPPTCTPVAISGQPQSATITAGSSRTLTVTATGTAPISYQWYIGTSGNTSNPISGATSSSLDVTPGSTTSYWVRVTNSCGAVNSNTATITVNAPAPGQSQTTVTRADFNGDGRSDIFWHNPSTGQTSTWLMNGTNTPTALTSPTLPLGWEPVATGDFNADGKGDLFWRHASTGETSVWLMNGGTYMVAFRTATMPTAWTPVVSADFDGNGRTDLFWRNSSTGQNQVWFMNGASQPTAVNSTSVAVEWDVVVAGDFNGDRKGDIFWRNRSTGETSVWLMNGASYASAFRTITVPGPWEIVGSVDFNGDQRGDVFWFNPTTGATSIWLMTGTASPGTYSTPTMTVGWRPVNFGDYNGNGTGDVFWHNPSNGQTRVWLMLGVNISSQGNLITVPPPWRVAAP